ncbi:hypothetical protein [uncultured Roseobacter sp.]|uniref:hypothetical protein n=2 Tax=uncultured Roseobacter sp. TaxID=114847 RepID=UPI002632FFE9|nr:hypothetical protein [uncultured Roseobacter sp.]
MDLDQHYRKQLSVQNFRTALNNLNYLATWDDHDLGPDNSMGGSDDGLKHREEARRLFLSHIGRTVKPEWNLVDDDADEIYCAADLDGTLVIVLDGRFYREPLQQNPNAELLGPKQTAWLWGQLDRALGDEFHTTLVCCGSTLNANPDLGESISHYSAFYDQFKMRFGDCPRPIFVSGDIHRNRIYHHGFCTEVVSSGVAQRRIRGDLSGKLFNKKRNLNNWGNCSFIVVM